MACTNLIRRTKPAQVHWSRAVESVEASTPCNPSCGGLPHLDLTGCSWAAEQDLPCHQHQHGPRPQDQDQELPRHRVPHLRRVQRREVESGRGGQGARRPWKEVRHCCWLPGLKKAQLFVYIHFKWTASVQTSGWLPFHCHQLVFNSDTSFLFMRPRSYS